jgi:integrase
MGKRRGHGEGSIHQRGDGRWCALVDLGIINGKRKRKYIYGDTRKEVAEKLKVALRDQQLGLVTVHENQTVTQFLTAWLEQSVKPTNKPSTHQSYRDIIKRHIEPAIGHIVLSKLTPQHIQALLATLQAKKLSPRTVQYARAILHHALDQALKWGYVARNVVALVEAPRVERHAVEPLTEAQATALLQAVAGHRLEALYRIALGLGLRRGEVLALRWVDIDLKARTLRVTAGKTASSTRTLPLPETLVDALKVHEQRQQVERAESDAWRDQGLVFPSEVGTPISGRNLLRHFKSVLKRVGLPQTIRFHDLRHSCATFLIAQGVHPRVVMEILGHSQISVTMNTYGHVLPETQQDAVQKLDAFLRRQPDDPAASS